MLIPSSAGQPPSSSTHMLHTSVAAPKGAVVSLLYYPESPTSLLGVLSPSTTPPSPPPPLLYLAAQVQRLHLQLRLLHGLRRQQRQPRLLRLPVGHRQPLPLVVQHLHLHLFAGRLRRLHLVAQLRRHLDLLRGLVQSGPPRPAPHRATPAPSASTTSLWVLIIHLSPPQPVDDRQRVLRRLRLGARSRRLRRRQEPARASHVSPGSRSPNLRDLNGERAP